MTTARSIPVAARLAGVLVAAALVAGCAGEPEGPRLEAPADATVGGTLDVAVPPPASVDPGNAHEPVGTLIAATMCDTLLGVDHETGELVPGLAETWTVTDGGERVILRLRDGLEFHDGTEVTAGDVVYSLSRIASAAYAGHAAELLSPVVGYREIRGQVIDAPQHLRERLGGVQLLTEQTVQITLSEPQAEFVKVLTHPATAPVSRAAAEADPETFAQQPVCAGPYALAEPWEPGDRAIRLVRDERYHGLHGAYTGGGAGYADEIVLHVLPELAAITDPSEAEGADVDVEGDVGSDVAGDTEETGADPSPEPDADPEVAPPSMDGFDAAVVPAWMVGSVDGDPDLDLVTATGPGVEFVGVPIEGPALIGAGDDDEAGDDDGAGDDDAAGDDGEAGGGPAGRELRVALSQALDRRHIAERVLDGTREPATGFLPPTLGTAVIGSEVCAGHAPATGDVAAARDRLERAGISLRGHVFELAFNDELRNADLVGEVARQWEEAFGVTVDLRGLSWEEYREEIEQVGGPRAAFRLSWSVPYPSADRYLHPLFHTGGIGRANLSGYSDAGFERLITEEAREAAEEADRVLLYRELEDHVCTDMPLIPVVVERTTFAVRGDRVGSAAGVHAGGPRGELLLRELYTRGR